MIELTIWPPSVGSPSTRITLRPSLAASSAAEMPALPAPTTQMSALTSCGDLLSRRTVRVSVATASAIFTPQKTPRPRRRDRRKIEHDPEKGRPVFGKDHAPANVLARMDFRAGLNAVAHPPGS